MLSLTLDDPRDLYLFNRFNVLDEVSRGRVFCHLHDARQFHGWLETRSAHVFYCMKLRHEAIPPTQIIDTT